MQVFGYGEDALTFWAVTKKLDEVLKQLKDGSDPETCKVFYRPSFGRRGGEKRSEFGEFDAIIMTPQTVYLIESKWYRGEKFPKNAPTLKNAQIKRHKIFKWYRENWKGEDWHNFVEKNQEKFKAEFYGKIIPKKNAELTKNLITILEETREKHLINVLLVFHKEELPNEKTFQDLAFKVVQIKYKPTKGEYTEIT